MFLGGLQPGGPSCCWIFLITSSNSSASSWESLSIHLEETLEGYVTGVILFIALATSRKLQQSSRQTYLQAIFLILCPCLYDLRQAEKRAQKQLYQGWRQQLRRRGEELKKECARKARDQFFSLLIFRIIAWSIGSCAVVQRQQNTRIQEADAKSHNKNVSTHCTKIDVAS